MGKHFKKKSNKNIISIIFLLIFIALLIISLTKIINWYINNQENKKIKEELSDVVTIDEIDKVDENEVKYNVDFEKLKEKNSDTVAWLKVNGTKVEYSVVQASDNSYYLNHNFNKEYNVAGWIFADYRNKFDGTDKNIVIYGHNMKDNSMFGSLKNILKEDWYNNEENYIINFITQNKNEKYEVFSVYQIEAEEYYTRTNFKNKEFSKYIKTVKNRSIKDFNVEVKEEDRILTLSTCANNNKYRVVLHAKKIIE